jgi:hypothetical protein
LPKNIPHKNQHVKWHFIYFGYSRAQRKARAYVKFADSDSEMNYDDINHFLPERLLVFIGRDIKNPNFYSGKAAYVNVLLGKGAFKSGRDFDEQDDPFGFTIGLPL